MAIFNKKDPIVLGVDVERGILRIGTPLVVYDKEVNFSFQRKNVHLGKVTSIEANHKPLQTARKQDGKNMKSGSVAIKIQGDTSIAAEKHFALTDKLCSFQDRKSLDCLLEYFRDDMTNPDWDLVRELKPFFEIFTAKK